MRIESSRHQYVSDQSAAVSSIAQRKREYFKNQISSCDGNQERLFKVMDDFMERRSDLMLLHCLFDGDLEFLFLFFSQKRSQI